MYTTKNKHAITSVTLKFTIDIFEAEVHAASLPSTSTMNVCTNTTPRGSAVTSTVGTI